jgi:hypothetical protein
MTFPLGAARYGKEDMAGLTSRGGAARRVDDGVRSDIFSSATRRWRILLVAS